MSAQQKDTLEKPVLFIVSAMLIILTLSFPLFSPLLFGVLPIVFALIKGEKKRNQLLILSTLGFTVFLIIFINQFFIQGQIYLLLLACLYFTVLLGLDIYIGYYAIKHPYAPALIFGYIVLTRFILSQSTMIFPFYWTITMHLLPFMGTVSRFVNPLCWEALCVTFAAMIYSPNLRKPTLPVQAIIIIFIAIGLTSIARVEYGSTPFKPGLECAFVQGGYSQQDYDQVSRHPILGRKIEQKYLDYIEEVTNARFVILPESAFPLTQIENSQIIQSLQDLAHMRNEYIMAGILLEEGENAYNAMLLINPEGQIQNIYRKRTTVLFMETKHFTQGLSADIFLVDGHIIAPVICYESLFIRNYFRDQKPELYIVLSNDTFAEKTILYRLHQAYGVINARTLRTPLLQIVQNGPSFYVDSQGELTNYTMPYQKVIGLSIKIR
jgi:apolipoprotein N-acyltransferase